MTKREFDIVLIEDNQPDVFLVRTALEEAGIAFRLEVCSDGDRALDRVVAIRERAVQPPDLLLLDLNLPKRSGSQILQQLRSTSEGRQVPVIVLSSSDSPRDRAQAADFGVRCFFRKPPDLEEFMRLGTLIRKILAEVEPIESV
jgi:DNA-binding response OmpR family regulator